jgi:hypothetical protein
LEYQSIRKITWEPSKETLPEFFTKFEISTGHTNYLEEDKELIHFLEEKIPHIITNNYTMEEPLLPQLTMITRIIFSPSTLVMNISK